MKSGNITFGNPLALQINSPDEPIYHHTLKWAYSLEMEGVQQVPFLHLNHFRSNGTELPIFMDRLHVYASIHISIYPGADPGFEKGGFSVVPKCDTGGATNNY